MVSVNSNGPAGSIGFVGIPTCLSFLEAERRFVGWRYVCEAASGTSRRLSSSAARRTAATPGNDPETWATYGDARKAFEAGGLSGIGVQHKGMRGVATFDLDKVRGPTNGRLLPWAQDVVDRSKSYAELSPSSLGVRIFGRVDPDHESVHASLKQHPKGGGFEIFVNTGRYATFTGAKIPGAPDEMEDITALIAELLAFKNEQEKATREKARKAARERTEKPARGRRSRTGASLSTPASTTTTSLTLT